MNGRCFIFGALPVEELKAAPGENDFVIAADKGVLSLEKLGIKPDVIIGDFDSLGFVPEGNVIKLPVKKDKTDVGYAADYAFEKGYKTFYVYGAFGGLADHTVANLQISADISAKGGRMFLLGEKQTAFCITDSTVKINGSGRLSVFAFGKKARGVTVTGAEYTLENADLDPFFPLGVSNSFLGAETQISVKSGTLLIIYDN
ncbi:MAG: thiamine diphosphokinase [Clostridia bacterium]|nr:thiamine diphosphokinase [Clostridia bacterium]